MTHYKGNYPKPKPIQEIMIVTILTGMIGTMFTPLLLYDKNAPPRSIRKSIEEVMTADRKLERTITTPEGYEYVLKECYDKSDWGNKNNEEFCRYSLKNYCRFPEREK